MATAKKAAAKKPAAPKPGNIEDLIRKAARKYDIREDVLLAIGRQESSLTDPPEVGAAGEIGPLQVTPPAMTDMNHFIDLDSTLEDKINTGARWFRYLLNNARRALYMYADTPEVYRLAVRAYNAGFHGAAVLERGHGYLADVRSKGAEWLS
jgi:soluble lytic murein transglycosylase-like protein